MMKRLRALWNKLTTMPSSVEPDWYPPLPLPPRIPQELLSERPCLWCGASSEEDCDAGLHG